MTNDYGGTRGPDGSRTPMSKVPRVRRGWWRLQTTLIGALLALALLSRPQRAQAQVQVSDEFSRVAKALAKRVTADSLKKVCEDKPEDTKAICETITGAAAEAFVMAIDGKVDEQALAAVLTDLATRLTEAAAADAVRQLLQTLLNEADKATSGTCRATIVQGGKTVALAPATVADQVVACALGRALRGDPAACKVAQATLQSMKVGCQPSPGKSDGYEAALLVTQLQTLLANGAPSGFYSAVAKGAAQVDTIFAGLDSPNDMVVFGDAELAAVLANASDPACTNGAALRSRLSTWHAEREGVFVALSRALATFHPLPAAELAKIPVNLPDPQCPPGHKLLAPLTLFQRSAKAYRTDLIVVHAADPIVLPSLLGALLVDYARTHDARLLRESATDFALRVLARAIAAQDKNGVFCDGTRCREIAPSSPPIPPIAQPAIVPPKDLQEVIEERFSPASARRTCEYQAIASALGRNITLGPSRACRPLAGGTQLLSVPPFSDALDSLPAPANPPPPYRTWAKPMPIAYQTMRLPIAGEIDPSAGILGLAAALEVLQDVLPTELAALARSVTDALGPVGEQRSFDFSRSMLSASARQLHPLVDAFLDRRLQPMGCAATPDAKQLSCGVRLLIGAVYDPMVEYISIENPSDADRRRLATLAYKKALELDPLSRTPLLFNVGLGFTALTESREGDASAHLTLLDKFGLAHRWGERNAGEVGIFVGGFLDSIIREAADSDEQQQYWLVGATVGARQLCAEVPFGVGAHVAAAMPYDLTKVEDQIALAGGITFTVPADIAFGD